MKSRGSEVGLQLLGRCVFNKRIINRRTPANTSDQEFVLGFYEAFAGVVRHPYIGAQTEGPIGAVKGVGRAFSGFGCHILAGTST